MCVDIQIYLFWHKITYNSTNNTNNNKTKQEKYRVIAMTMVLYRTYKELKLNLNLVT